MSARIKLSRSPEGIATVREAWLDELEKPEKVEREREKEKQEYLSQLTERHRHVDHVRALLEQVLRLQRVKRVREQAQESNDHLETRFEILKEQWLNETGYLSDPVKKILHPAHLKIIGMGEKVLPLILREVQKMSGHWFVALSAISPENPVRSEDEGSVEKIGKAWLRWGKERGLIDI